MSTDVARSLPLAELTSVEALKMSDKSSVYLKAYSPGLIPQHCLTLAAECHKRAPVPKQGMESAPTATAPA